MIDWINVVVFSLVGAMMLMMLFGIGLSILVPTLDRWSRRFFVALFSLFFLCCVCCFLAELFWEDPTKAVESRIIYMFEGLFLSTPIFMPIFFLLHHCGEAIKSSLLFKLVTALLGIFVAFLVSTQFTTVFYYVTDDNHFTRGPLWALWLVPLVLMMFLNIVALIKRRNKLPSKYFVALLIYLVPMTVSIFTHMFIHVEIFIIFSMAILALVVFALILKDNVEKYTHSQQEIANQRASVMVLQMRPHFIYNTMTTIYYLCKQDADKAQQVTLDFTNYLRNNFNAIASEGTIPFSTELEHTKTYLVVEQAQHENMLVVKYDTPIVDFRLPPLTLQPIVENSVKHGMDPNSDEPLCISVKTQLMNDNIIITVEDTGVGFDVDEGIIAHTALSNIQQRLKMMCNGTLTISSGHESGTTVKISVPYKAKS